LRAITSDVLRYRPIKDDRKEKAAEMEAEAKHYALHARAYAMKKHHATRLHYDLRLEWNGVLLSWALSEDLSCHAGAIRKAIEMEDHSRANLLFEGVHKTGPIMLWDRGTWEPHLESDDIESSLQSGVLRFMLHGEKLKGAWTLTRTNTARKTPRPVWTLCKHADAFAESRVGRCVFAEQPNSVTGKTMEEIVQGWTRPKDRHEQQLRLFDI
jgi:bifunctional non-homologous end joining protein LigD